MPMPIANALARIEHALAGGRRQHVGGVLVEDRHGDGDELGDEQDAEGEHHAGAQVRATGRPDERQEPAEHLPVAGAGGDIVFFALVAGSGRNRGRKRHVTCLAG